MMQLNNSFAINRGHEEAWNAIQNIEQMALCMPGATLTSLDGNSFSGIVSVKLGPLKLVYKGEGEITRIDSSTGELALRLKAKESKGGGTAAAVVTASVNANSVSQTTLDITTDLNLTGRPAQFGRGALSEVSASIISQFADNLATELSPQKSTMEAEAIHDVEHTGDEIQTENEVLDLGRTALSVLRSHPIVLGSLLGVVMRVLTSLLRKRYLNTYRGFGRAYKANSSYIALVEVGV